MCDCSRGRGVHVGLPGRTPILVHTLLSHELNPPPIPPLSLPLPLPHYSLLLPPPVRPHRRHLRHLHQRPGPPHPDLRVPAHLRARRGAGCRGGCARNRWVLRRWAQQPVSIWCPVRIGWVGGRCTAILRSGNTARAMVFLHPDTDTAHSLPTICRTICRTLSVPHSVPNSVPHVASHALSTY